MRGAPFTCEDAAERIVQVVPRPDLLRPAQLHSSERLQARLQVNRSGGLDVTARRGRCFPVGT
eukprot:231686-Pyramimonas_sp.AAC.1